MDREELLQILREAQEALAAGVPSIAINKRIEELTDGTFPGIMTLTMAVDPNVIAEEQFADQLQAVAEVSPTRNAIEGFMHGVTFGGLDDVIGMFNPEAGEALRRRQRAREETDPLVSGALTVGGAALSPVSRALGAGFKTLRGTGGAGRTIGAGAATGGVGAGAFGFLESEGTLGERAQAAGEAAVPGVVGGAAVPAAGAALRGAGRVARGMVGPRSATAGREAVEEAISGAARTPEEAAAFVRSGRALAELDPSIRARAAGTVREAPNLRRVGGPVEGLRATVSEAQVQAGKRAIFAPLEGQVVRSPAAMTAVRNNIRILDVVRKVVPGIRQDPSKLKQLSFREVQDIRSLLSKAARKASKDGLPSAFRQATDDLAAFDQAIDPVFPAFRQARRQFAELLGRQEEAGRLFASIEAAVPRSVRTGLPGTIQGPFTALRNQALNVEARKEAINEIVGEILLTQGEEGARLLENLLRGGFFARAFANPTAAGVTPGVISATGAAFGAQPGGLFEEF